MNRLIAVGLKLIFSLSLISCSSSCRKLHLDSTPKVDHRRQENRGKESKKICHNFAIIWQRMGKQR
jgi:hypothetical protein